MDQEKLLSRDNPEMCRDCRFSQWRELPIDGVMKQVHVCHRNDCDNLNGLRVVPIDMPQPEPPQRSE